MASAFNLNSVLNFVSNNSLTTEIAKANRQLKGISATVDLRFNARTNTQLNVLHKNLTIVEAKLKGIATQATAAAASMSKMASSLKSASASVASTNKALSKAGNSMKQVGVEAKVTGSEMEEFGRISALAIRRFAGFTIATGIVFGFIRSLTGAVSEAVDFQRELIRVAQVTKNTVSGLKGLTNEITKLSTSLGVSSTALLSVSRILAQTGLTARQTKTALEALALSTLAPTFTSIQNTTEGAIAAMRQFGIEAKDLKSVLGSINAVAGRFAVEADDIVGAIRRAGGVFATASTGLKDFAGNLVPAEAKLRQFIALFTSVRSTTRESAETIATGLRTVFTRIQRVGTIEQLKGLGIQLADAKGNFVGVFEAVRRLSVGLKDLDPRNFRFNQIVEQLGGFRQINKVIPIILRFEQAQKALKVAQEGTGSLADDAVTAQQALAVQLTKTREAFLALIRDFSNSGSFKSVVGLVLKTTKGLISLASAIKPILPILAAFAAIKGGIAIAQFTKGFFGGLKSGQGGSTSGAVAAGAVASGKTGRDASGANTHAINSNTKALERLIIALSKRALAPGFAHGGVVPGVGNTDSFPANLMPGEFVVRKKAVEAIGVDNLMQANRGGRVPFAAGGKVKTTDTVGLTTKENKRRNFLSELNSTTKKGTRKLKDDEKVELKGLDNLVGQTRTGLTAMLPINGFAGLFAKMGGESIPGSYTASDIGIAQSDKNKIQAASGLPKNKTSEIRVSTRELGQFHVSSPQIADEAASITKGLLQTTAERTAEVINQKTKLPTGMKTNTAALKLPFKEQESNIQGIVAEGILRGVTGATDSGPKKGGKSTFDLKPSAGGQFNAVLDDFNADLFEKFGLGDFKLTSTGDAVQKILKNSVNQTSFTKFAEGGGNGKDTVKALLTPGEFVLSQPSASAIGAKGLNALNNADKLNKGGAVGFNKGGPVGMVKGGFVGELAKRSDTGTKELKRFNASLKAAGLALNQRQAILEKFSKQRLAGATEAKSIRSARGAGISIDAIADKGLAKGGAARARSLKRSGPGNIASIRESETSARDKAADSKRVAAQNAQASKSLSILDSKDVGGKNLPKIDKSSNDLARAFKVVSESASKLKDKFDKTSKSAGGRLQRFTDSGGVGGAIHRGANTAGRFALSPISQTANFFKGKGLSGAGGGRISKGFNKIGGRLSGSGGIGAALLAPALIQSLAPNDKEVATEGFAQKRALAGGATGAVSGAFLGGQVAGPIGAVVGGLAGAANGFVDSLNDAEEAVALDKLAKSTKKLDKAFEAFEKGGSIDALNNAIEAQINAALAAAQVDQDKAERTIFGVLGGTGDAAGADAGFLTNVLRGAKVSLGASANLLGFQNNFAKEVQDDQVKDIQAKQTLADSKLLAQSDPAVQKQLRAIDKLVRSGDINSDKDIKEQIFTLPGIEKLLGGLKDPQARQDAKQQFFDQGLISKIAVATEEAAKKAAASFDSLVQRLDSASQSLAVLQDNLEFGSKAFDDMISRVGNFGAAASVRTQGVDNIAALSNVEGRQRVETLISGAGARGTSLGRGIRDTTLGAQEIRKKLPEILREAFNNAAGRVAPDAEVHTIAQALQSDDLSSVPKIIRETILDGFRDKLLKSRQADLGAEGIKDVLSKVDLGKTFDKIGEIGIKLANDLSKSLNKINATYEKAIGQLVSTQLKINAEEDKVLQIRSGGAQSIRKFGAKPLTIGESSAVEDARITRLAVGRGGAASTDVSDITRKINSLTSRQAEIDEIRRSGEGNVGERAASLESEETKNRVALVSLQQALQAQTQATAKQTAISEKLAGFESRRQAAKGLADRLLGASPSEILDINRDIANAMTILANGNREGFHGPQVASAASFIQSVIGFLPEERQLDAQRQVDQVRFRGVNAVTGGDVGKIPGLKELLLTQKGEAAGEQNLLLQFQESVNRQAEAQAALAEKMNQQFAPAIVAAGALFQRASEDIKVAASRFEAAVISELKKIGPEGAPRKEGPPAIKAGGGRVMGSYSGTDSVHTRLTPGEFVVKRSVAQDNMGFLSALNSGTQKLARGGQVTDFGLTAGDLIKMEREQKFAQQDVLRRNKTARETRQEKTFSSIAKSQREARARREAARQDHDPIMEGFTAGLRPGRFAVANERRRKAREAAQARIDARNAKKRKPLSAVGIDPNADRSGLFSFLSSTVRSGLKTASGVASGFATNAIDLASGGIEAGRQFANRTSRQNDLNSRKKRVSQRAASRRSARKGRLGIGGNNTDPSSARVKGIQARREKTLALRSRNRKKVADRGSGIDFGEVFRGKSTDTSIDFSTSKEERKKRAILARNRLKGFNGGGGVPGSGNSDSVAAMLTPGEFVVNKRDSQRNLSALRAMNKGAKVSKFQNGGQVGVPMRTSSGGGASTMGFDSASRSSLDGFNSAATTLKPSLDGFVSAIGSLTQAAKQLEGLNIPDKIEISVAPIQHTVNINGAEALAALEPVIQDMVTKQVSSSINQNINTITGETEERFFV